VKAIRFLALVPFLALSYLPAAHANEEASLLPWNAFRATADVGPESAVKLLATFRIGSRISLYRVPLSNCGNDVQSVNLKVSGASVTVQTFGIRFTDNSTREFNVNKTFNAGTESGWIDLGMFRAMDSRCPAEVYANALAPTGLATVQVFGNLR
jgi:hypothetical protein